MYLLKMERYVGGNLVHSELYVDYAFLMSTKYTFTTPRPRKGI